MAPDPAQSAKWCALRSIDRRVLGVLGEKGKTTPDQYPCSLNYLRSGCNQKSNRDPVMELEEDDIVESLERLRQVGAIGAVQGSGRVERYRHYLYEWFGFMPTERVEIGVLIELLLRGAQTEGELRGRAARMDPIADLNALRPVLNNLKARNLIVSITPEGRGHIVTHNLYLPEELAKVRRQFANMAVPDSVSESTPASRSGSASGAPVSYGSSAHAAHSVTPESSPMGGLPNSAGHADFIPPAAAAPNAAIEELRRLLDSTREQLAETRGELEELTAKFERLTDEVHDLRSQLGG